MADMITVQSDAATAEVEALPDDGAVYRCNFGTFLDGEEWRCERVAVGALPWEVHDKYMAKLAAHGVDAIVLHGRAMCEVHAIAIAVAVGRQL